MKLVKIHVIGRNVEVLTDVAFLPTEKQIDKERVFIGSGTRDGLTKLDGEGDISSQQRKAFFAGFRVFYKKAASASIQNPSCLDENDEHANYVNFEERESATFGDVLFF